MAKRKQYSNEFKVAAVQQWQESGKSAAEMAEELDVSTSSLYTWRDQLADEEVVAEPSEEVTEPAVEELAVEEPAAEEPVDEEPVAKELEGEKPVGDAPEVEPVAAETEQPEASEEAEDVPMEQEPVVDKPVPEEVAVAAVASDEVTEAEEEPAKKGGAKAIIKRILGAVGVLLGGIGLLLSIALIIVVWVLNTPVTNGAVEIVGKVEFGLTVANDGLDQADETLDNVRQQLREITEAVPLDNLQSTIVDIQALVDGILATIDTAASVVGLADTFPVSLLRGDSDPVDTPKLDEASATLAEISAGLGSVNDVLVERQESGLGPVGTEIDTKIDNFQGSLGEVNQRVEESITATIQLQEDLPGIIDTIAIIFTLLFLWLGVAQYSLLVHGWHWLRWP